MNDVQRGPAKVLATALRDSLRGAGFPDSDYIGRGGLSPRRDLAGLNLATRPTALVECANMRNAAEAALVSTTRRARPLRGGDSGRDPRVPGPLSPCAEMRALALISAHGGVSAGRGCARRAGS